MFNAYESLFISKWAQSHKLLFKREHSQTVWEYNSPDTDGKPGLGNNNAVTQVLCNSLIQSKCI